MQVAPFMHGADAQLSGIMRVWQVAPLHTFGQMHPKPLIAATHVPPCKHGADAQLSTNVHVPPLLTTNPALHVQLNVSTVPKFHEGTHVPFTHAATPPAVHVGAAKRETAKVFA